MPMYIYKGRFPRGLWGAATGKLYNVVPGEPFEADADDAALWPERVALPADNVDNIDSDGDAEPIPASPVDDNRADNTPVADNPDADIDVADDDNLDSLQKDDLEMLLADHSLSIENISGTGSSGRVINDDMRRYLRLNGVTQG